MRVFIASLPKSGSTSLAKLICETQGLENRTPQYRERLFRRFRTKGLARPLKYGFMAYWHSDLFYEELVEQLAFDNDPHLLKFHWDYHSFPWSEITDDDRVIFLYRDIDEIVLSYSKGHASRVYPWKGPFKLPFVNGDFHAVLSEEHHSLHQSWLGAKESRDFLSVDFNKLINSFPDEMQRIAKFLGDQREDKEFPPLPRERFSGDQKGYSLKFVLGNSLRLVWSVAELIMSRNMVHVLRRRAYGFVRKY